MLQVASYSVTLYALVSKLHHNIGVNRGGKLTQPTAYLL